MKKLVAVLLILTVSACTSGTEFGPCIGAFDDGDKELRYETSGRNVGVSIASFLIPPVGFVVAGVTVASQLRCPVAQR